MARQTYIQVDPLALVHNVKTVKIHAPHQKIMAMVKANAYGCRVEKVLPAIHELVDVLGVACLAEALQIRALGSHKECMLIEGVFSQAEWRVVDENHFQAVIHQERQLNWLLTTPLKRRVKVWIKVDTGMHRLGFAPQKVEEVLTALKNCKWVDEEIGIMTHFASADTPEDPSNQKQLELFQRLPIHQPNIIRSMANSAALLSSVATHFDMVRPGIMLYGVSPFADKTGTDLGLIPAMRFMSVISAIHHLPPHSKVGYSGTWSSHKPSRIGVVAAGYGDGYPRQIGLATPVWINSHYVPIVGRVSMDMLTIDLTEYTEIQEGDSVELWGNHLPVEWIARSAGTIGYELLCQVTARTYQ